MEGFASRGFVGLPANEVQISQEEFRAFHSIDRKLFAVLVADLWRDPVQAMQIMALWLWLERAGFFNIVKKILQLPLVLINELGDEAVVCLKYFNTAPTPHENEPAGEIIPLTQNLIQKDFSIQYLIQNQASAKLGMEQVHTNVCIRAFSDLMQLDISIRHDAQRLIQSQQGQAQQAMLPGGSIKQNQVGAVPAEERTVIVTFSKGYPVAELEVRNFFTNMFGDCIESFFMQDVTNTNDQPLFARIVFFRANVIHGILNAMSKVKFTINGKHVWTRSYSPRKPEIRNHTSGTSA